MELASDRADDLAEAALVGGVDVLVAVLDLEGVGGPLLANLAKALDELVALGVGDDARLRERAGVAHRSADVLLRHAAVEGQGLVELLHQRVDVLAEATAPELLLLSHSDHRGAAAGEGTDASGAKGEAAPTTTGRAAERADERKLRAEGAATAWQTDIAIG